MDSLALFALHVLVYAAFPLAFAAWGSRQSITLLYIYIAAVLAFGGFLGQVYSLPLGAAGRISGGSIAYVALLYSALILVIVARDIQVIRNVVGLVVTVDALTVFLFALVSSAMSSPSAGGTPNPVAQLFALSLPLVITGGVLIVGELLAMLVVFGQINRRVKTRPVVLVLYVICFVVVLACDGVLFPVLSYPWAPFLLAGVPGGVLAKFVVGVAFGVPLLGFMFLMQPRVAAFEADPPVLRDLFQLGRRALVLEIQRQEGALLSATTELQTSRALLGSIVDATPDAIFAKDLRGRYLLMNRSALEIVGKSEAETLGKDDTFLFGPDEGMVVMQGDSEAMRAPAPVTFEETVTDATGSARTFLSTKGPLRDPDGSVTGMFGVARDITARKRAEEARVALETRLQQAQKMESVGRLAGGVAHDSNNMLSAILGNTELALEALDPSHPVHADLLEIQRAARRSADLTRQLLAFARRTTVEPVVLDLNEELPALLPMLGRLIGEGIELGWQPGADLWPVRIDAAQVDHVVTNLCLNARDAIADVGAIMIATANASADTAFCADHVDAVPGDYVRLTVTDTGRGMDQDVLDNIFEPFFTTKAVGEGTGLGLATVYGSVRQNDGFITVSSEPGHGSTFEVYLPRHVGQVAAVVGTGVAAPALRGTETILLVEDEPAILRVTARMLEAQGYKVLAATNPGEAIHLASQNAGDIHLLVTDLVMPGMNGRDLARTLLSLYPGLKCALMSGHPGDLTTAGSQLEAGVPLIQKPFSVQDLATAVREALDYAPESPDAPTS